MKLLIVAVSLFTVFNNTFANKTIEIIEDRSEVFADEEIPLRIIEIDDENLERRTNKNDPYRLPTSIVPRNYTITLVLKENFGPDGVFTGSVVINLDILETVQTITLQAQYLTIKPDSISLTCGNNITNLFYSLTNDTAYHKIIISSTEELTAGSSCVLQILNYEGVLDDDMRGLYRSSYTNKNGETE